MKKYLNIENDMQIFQIGNDKMSANNIQKGLQYFRIIFKG